MRRFSYSAQHPSKRSVEHRSRRGSAFAAQPTQLPASCFAIAAALPKRQGGHRHRRIGRCRRGEDAGACDKEVLVVERTAIGVYDTRLCILRHPQGTHHMRRTGIDPRLQIAELPCRLLGAHGLEDVLDDSLGIVGTIQRVLVDSIFDSAASEFPDRPSRSPKGARGWPGSAAARPNRRCASDARSCLAIRPAVQRRTAVSSRDP